MGETQTPRWPSNRKLINEAVLRVLEPDALKSWWDTPVAQLGGYTPEEMYRANQGSTVLSLAESYSDSSFG